MGEASDILAGLDDEQRAAAMAVEGPVRILAGPGSGKTRTITHRIAYACAVGAQRADKGLAVTFTARAAGQLRARLAALGVSGVSAMTFHSAALRQLRHFWPQAVGGSAPQLVAIKAPLLAETAAGLGLPRDRTVLRDLAGEVEWAKVSRIASGGYVRAAAAAGRTVPQGLTAEAVALAYGSYCDLLAERGLMDFEDVLVLTTALLTDRPDLGDVVRNRYRWITVDEYQDVSAVQQGLLDVWTGDTDQTCVVGDPGQTIYTFAGASASHLHEFPQRHPRAATFVLHRSYRCSPQVVRTANRLMAAAPQSRAAALRLTSAVADGSEVSVRWFGDDLAEADAVSQQVGRWRDAGVPLREIAILVRTNAATAPLEDALAEAGIPYTVTGGERFFARAEVREAMLRLRGAANTADARTGGLTGPVAEVLAAMGFSAGAPPVGRGAARERWESLAALSALAADLAARDEQARLADVVAELDRRSALEAEPVPDGAVLATMHAAKGLEWDAVWIAGVQEGTLPISYADTAERVEEERRLFYVGITRARRELVLSWSQARAGDRAARRSPSRFLVGIEAAPQAGPAQSGTSSGAPRSRSRRSPGLGRCRICDKGLPTAGERALQRCRTCPADVDVDLLERLRTWRRDQVAGTRTAAFTVFTDVTLQAIAELRPQSIVDLRSISGIGPVKAERYGDALLALVSGRTEHHG